MTSTNLSITGLTQRDIDTFNTGCDDLDSSITETFIQDVGPPGNAATIATDSFQRSVSFTITSTVSPSADDTVVITVPAIKRGLFSIINETGQLVQVQISGQPLDPASVPVDSHRVLLSDGVNVRDPLPSISQILSGSYLGSMPVSEEIWRSVLSEPFTLPSGLTGSQGYVRIAPAAQTDFDIKVNGVSKGTMSFTSSYASFTFASPVDLIDGDVVTIETPNPSDVTLEDLTFSLALEETP